MKDVVVALTYGRITALINIDSNIFKAILVFKISLFNQF